MTVPKTSTNTKPSNQPPPTVHTGISAAREIVRNRQQRHDDSSGRCCARLAYLLVGLMLVGFACSGLLVYREYDLDRFNLHSYHDGDQVLASDAASDLNTILCQSYAVSSSDRANVYLINGTPKISPTARELISLRNTGLKAELQYDYRAFYLLPGSSIKIEACMSVFNENPHAQAEVLFFKGDKHYNRWRSDPDCRHCIHHRIPIPENVLCEKRDVVVAEHVVGHKDTYYIVITRQQGSDDHEAVRAEIDMQVVKTVYDVSNFKAMCRNAVDCVLNLTYASDEDVVVEFTYPEYSYPGSVTYFTTACELRRSFWIVVFGIIPTAMVGLLVFVACFCGILRENDKKKGLQKKAASKLVFAVTAENSEEPGVLPV